MSNFIANKNRLINLNHVESICRAESEEQEETRVIFTMKGGQKIIVSSDYESLS